MCLTGAENYERSDWASVPVSKEESGGFPISRWKTEVARGKQAIPQLMTPSVKFFFALFPQLCLIASKAWFGGQKGQSKEEKRGKTEKAPFKGKM